MESLGLFEILLIVGTSICGAGIIAGLAKAVAVWGQPIARLSRGLNVPTFLFQGDDLVDATESAQQIMADKPGHLSEKQAFVSLFKTRFPTLDDVMSRMEPGSETRIPAADDASMSLLIEGLNTQTRVTLLGTTDEESGKISDIAAQDALVSEVGFLRSVINAAPFPIWVQDATGKLNWANATYMALSDGQSNDPERAGQKWPDQAIFKDLHVGLDPQKPLSRRVSLPLPDNLHEDWFEVTSKICPDGTLHFACDANDTVIAENSKVAAMETFGRLFGDLSTGLAIFDQKRRLATFNPALTKLTGLQPSFLLERPTVDMFLDALRESRVLPEPKNYTSWRDQFSALETAARAGTYCENWDLIDGQTFRVTGRPYSDNSFVFLFDDLTADISLTRRFKSEIATTQGVLDTMEEAIAVFSVNGTMVLSNKAYEETWQSHSRTTLHTHDLRSEIVKWQSQCAAAPTWSDLREFIANPHKKVDWIDHAILDDGRQMECRARGINQGMTMISFGVEKEKMKPVIHKLTMADPGLQSLKS